PVLVGTTSVERSEYLSKLLVKRRIPHNVLNAKHHEKESAIVAEAGHAGAVTVATNMAGRGTDIMLGGNPDHLAENMLRAKGLDPIETPEEWTAALPDALEQAQDEVREEAERVREAGGLYVLGTERHESRRIDNQLRGRSGRQGDPGASRFYLSLGDELMRRFNAQFVERVMTTMRVPDDQPIEAKMVSKAIKSAQTQVEQQNFEARKNLLKYDEVMNQQRKEIYANRMRVLKGEDLREHVENMIEEVVSDYVHKATADGYAEDWDHVKLWSALKELYPITLRWEDLVDDMEDRGEDLTAENLLEAILADIRKAYREREEDINSKVPVDAEGQEGMRRLERIVMLDVLDRKWREHLYEMDYLKDGIGLRAMAQRDPLIEYQREGYDMFNTMLDGLKEECITLLFRAQVAEPQSAQQAEPPAQQQAPAADRGARAQQAAARAAQAQAAQAQAAQAAARQEDKIPPALRGGLRPSEQQYTYSGPAEGGGVQSRGAQSTGGNGQKPTQGAGGTRRERRAAARDAAKKGKKGTRR
ncbi:MAG TPA: preprotein translocase subunit SecA, partial [Actinophytocola sp.]|nr:preprotein translocase subunit SecA [Actinophytocola sp.]